jgi:transposase, IS5 family
MSSRWQSGEAGWPPLALFRALLIGVWHDLSDVKLAEALEDRASSRRFCGFSRFEPTPERTAFVRFRRMLLSLGLDRVLFERVGEQLRARSVTVKTGTLVDATVIATASEADGEAGWSGHRARKAIHGYKAHVAADADTGFVERVDVTPGNVHDGRAGGAVVPDDPGLVYADSAYRGARFAEAVRALGGVTRVAPPSTGAAKAARKRRRPSPPRSGRSSASARASRRSSGPGSAATACAGCDGAALPRLCSRST